MVDERIGWTPEEEWPEEPEEPVESEVLTEIIETAEVERQSYDPGFLIFLFTLQKGIRKGELSVDDLIELGFDHATAEDFVAEA